MKRKYLEEVMKRIFNSTDTEIACLLKIYSNGEATSFSLAKLLKKDVSHISRCLKKLLDNGLVIREAKCCSHGKKGRYWIYKPLPKSKFKKNLRERTNELHKEILKKIRKL